MDPRAFLAVITAYARVASQAKDRSRDGFLEKVLALHYQISRKGCDRDIFVASSLVDLYAKIGSMVDARIVFDRMKEHNIVSWTSLVIGYVENGEAGVALDLFGCFQSTGLEVNSRMLMAAVMACGSKQDGSGRTSKMECLDRGVDLYEQAKFLGLDDEVFVANSLIGMFAKCGSMERARRVFEETAAKNVVSWTTLMQGYVDNGEEEMALEVFARMEASANAWTFTTALACSAALAAKGGDAAKNKWLEKTKAVHDQAVEAGCFSDVAVANSVIFAYMKCGSTVHAERVFSSIQQGSNVVSWTSMILGYTENGQHEQALEVFSGMKASGCVPDSRAYVAVLSALASLAKRDSDQTDLEETVKTSQWLDKAVGIHREVTAMGIASDTYVASTLLDVYAKFGRMEDACKVFRGMGSRSAVSWNTIILGYVKNGSYGKALETFAAMKLDRWCCEPNAQTYIAVLAALAGSSTNPETGREIHGEICRRALIEQPQSSPPVLATSLLDFYAKSGSMAAAQNVFDSVLLGDGDAAIWNALISGYSFQGRSLEAFRLFQAMVEEGIRPDEVTFLSLLILCSHAGLLKEARKIFEEMSVVYGIEPRIEHHRCLIDLFARANCVDVEFPALNVFRN